MKNRKVANINIKVKDLFFKWMEITKPFHRLSHQQQQVLALFLYQHYKLKQEITNEKILWKMVFDYDTKVDIKAELKMKDPGFQNIMYQLRKRKVIKNGRVSPMYIPALDKGSSNFKIIFNFNVINERHT